MVIRLQLRWPLISRVLIPAPVAPLASPALVKSHRSWVRTPDGIGWINRHDSDGWWVNDLCLNEVRKYPFDQVENISPPDDTQ